MEDLEDDGDDEDDSGWGVSAVEAVPSPPVAKQPKAKGKEDALVSHLSVSLDSNYHPIFFGAKSAPSAPSCSLTRNKSWNEDRQCNSTVERGR